MHSSTTRILLGVAAVVMAGQSLKAQTAPMAGASAPSEGMTSIFAPLTIPPAPSETRLASGAPGPKYWQNRVDYDLDATLDTGTHTVRGSMTMRYTNNSPNVLKEFWMQTEQRSYVIDSFNQIVDGKPVSLGAGQHPGGDIFELQIGLAQPIAHGKTATFQMQWHYTIKKSEHDGPLYQISQWYPRLAVYDDVKGWNTESAATGAEYYLEYGDFTLSVTLPAGYIVAATGTLDNPKDVLTPAEIARLAVAAKADTVVRVVTEEELKSGAARPRQDGMLTWKFHANNVRDEVWCASPDYQWDATHWHGAIAQAYYRPKTAAVWGDGADQARMSIQEYSERWYPYPYPQISAIEGPEYGMEYPMLSMIGAPDTKPGLYAVLTHEIGHNWFPMVVGSNERMHTWMDEGFNTFINNFSEARRYPEGGTQEARSGKGNFKGNGPVLENGTPIGNTGPQYRKTAYVLELLRRDVLGPEVFDKAFKIYIQRWAYKHPTPMDFFRTMEDVSGQNLTWFWRTAFLEAPRFDQSVDSVKQSVQGNETHVTVTYGNKGRAVLPLIVHFTFSDSTKQDVKYPGNAWQADPTTYTVSYTFPKKTVSQIVLDPDNHLPDADRSNNVWTAK